MAINIQNGMNTGFNPHVRMSHSEPLHMAEIKDTSNNSVIFLL